MHKVIFKKAAYNYETLKPILFEMIDALSGNCIKRHDRVLIKPNLLLPAKPEKAILTHPLIVRIVAEYILNKGGCVQISDSPAIGSFEKILKEGGYKKVLNGLDVEFKEFKTSVKVDIGEPFGSIDIAKDAVEADVVINLAKLKTHSQMLLTIGVKNLFGCIVGLKKPEWHFKSGTDREIFAKLLVQIYNAIKPSITIIDGILAMEGQGPGKSGIPRHLGIVVGSNNAPAADMAICSMLGIEPDNLLTVKEAKKSGLTNNNLYISGDFYMVNDFLLPARTSLMLGPKLFHKFMRKYLLQRPVTDNHICQLCGECWQYCPTKAITKQEKGIDFDYDRCIRCYCCIEVCPHGALRSAEPLPGKILSLFR
ncbi:MAG: DUF362 domain-containing protein [Desulfobacterales bacterium]|uniref:DUF362 domain-containing protein n=1 Tax=Candidatus Desulfaltia bathyphila TaxID=2841697 RepID=A0A8J6TC36_9BACT|nr:DUF362 domain-containing protein [Candidatus Desulfaltia bathyphila]MBL7195285.1 DUF362 domain-containing protein [Desulfobacterales bacterium]MBL7207650.1 DUF362 domain-containing protein [Desulfobacterales bacterium]